MSELYPIKKSWAKQAKIDKIKYEKMYNESLSNNEGFWKDHAKRIEWFKPFSKIKDVIYSKDKVQIKWFYD